MDSGARDIDKPPAYCHNCGEPYSWTASRLEAAKELVQLSTTIDESAKEEVFEAIIATTTGTAKVSVGAERLKKYWPVLGKTLQDVVTNVLSETAKKILFP
jgi:hypothetical protein